MSSLSRLLGELDTLAAGARGVQFERVCKWLLESAPEYRQLLDVVWLWEHWPGRKGRRDTGIDLVARARDGTLWAIQAKAYDPNYYVTKQDIDSFLAASSRQEFSFRLLIATTDHFGPNARATLNDQEKPVHVRGRAWLDSLELEWPSHLNDLRPKPPLPKDPRPHQQEATSAVLRGLKVHRRVQLIMACGTGKTLVGLWVSEALQAKRTLVLLPSLALLSQTLTEWCANEREGFELIAVCSDQTVVDDYDAAIARTAQLGIPVTTSPDAIQRFIGGPGRRVVFGTYQSSPEIAKALRPVAGESQLSFDLVIADEAHRCAGRPSRAFSTVLDDEKIPALRRVFMTATPKVFTGKARGAGATADLDIASMDDKTVFGSVVHRLSFGEAISRDLLTDYQVAIVVTDDADVSNMVERGRFIEVDGTSVGDARSLAQQLAIAKLMCDASYRMRRIVSFHSRVKAARLFASSLPQTVKALPDDERPDGEIWAEHVSGDMPTDERVSILQRLRELAPGQRGLVANARCLTEGVDVPSLDAVAFLDPLRSKIDIVQAVGRAIPRSLDKTVGTVLLPVYVSSRSDAERALAGSAFAPVWDVLQALRAHDEGLARQMDELAQQMGERGADAEWQVGELAETAVVDQVATEQGKFALGKLRLSDKIRIVLPERLELSDFAKALRIQIVRHSTAPFEYGLGELRAYATREGHVRVPQPHITPSGFNLGNWVMVQRRWKRRGVLAPERAAALDATPGWMWGPYEEDFQRGLDELQAFAATEGHARVHGKHVTSTGFKLGLWVQKRRTRKSQLGPDRFAALEAIPGWTWDGQDKVQRLVQEVRAYVQQHGDARIDFRYVTPEGFPLGDGVMRVRSLARGTRPHGREKPLSPEDKAALSAIPGWIWDPIQARFDGELQHLRAYVEQEGHARVPRPFRTPDGFALGAWVAKQRTKRRTLSGDSVAALEALPGWTWTPLNESFQHGLDELRAYALREQHADVPTTFVAASGFRLGAWTYNRRAQHRAGKLTPDRIADLEAIPGWTWDLR